LAGGPLRSLQSLCSLSPRELSCSFKRARDCTGYCNDLGIAAGSEQQRKFTRP
jgi:hypothetical protein